MYLGNNYLRAFHGEWDPTQPELWISVASSLGIPYPLTQDKGTGLPPLMCPELLLSTPAPGPTADGRGGMPM